MKFGNKNGYKTFTHHGETEFVHKRVMEKKLGAPIPEGFVVHHINGRKHDNRPDNLVAIPRGVHGRLHGNHPEACFICGHDNHLANRCRARWNYAGKRIKK